jgi:hypothetical protein
VRRCRFALRTRLNCCSRALAPYDAAGRPVCCAARRSLPFQRGTRGLTTREGHPPPCLSVSLTFTNNHQSTPITLRLRFNTIGQRAPGPLRLTGGAQHASQRQAQCLRRVAVIPAAVLLDLLPHGALRSPRVWLRTGSAPSKRPVVDNSNRMISCPRPPRVDTGGHGHGPER